MGRSRILVANWFDYPRYYDIAFQTHTPGRPTSSSPHAVSIAPLAPAGSSKPACGTGRLITRLAARGYEVIGFDINQPALSYLRRRLARRRLRAETFQAEMSDFHLCKPVDAAYCTINTFRHLLTEQAARGHLEYVAESLRLGGIYILGFHLLPLHIDEEDVQRWMEGRGETKVTVTLRVLRTNLRRRIEDLEVYLLVRRGSKELRLRHEFPLRTYTARQFRRQLGSVPSLELCDVYDFHTESFFLRSAALPPYRCHPVYVCILQPALHYELA